MRSLISFAVVAVLVGAISAGDDGLTGSWKVNILEDGQVANLWLVQFETKAGKLTATAEGVKGVPPTTIHDVQVRGDLLSFDLKLANRVIFQFEAKTPRPGAKKVFGSITREGKTLPAFLEATSAKNTFELDREVVTRTPNDPRVFSAALDLIAQAKENKATAKDVQEWADTVLRTAEGFGPRFQLDYTMKIVDALGAEKDYAALAAGAALKAEKMLDPKASPLAQLKFLTTLSGALKKSGLTEQGAALEAKLEKLEGTAYIEYSKDSLGYNPPKYKGRKGKENRAVLVELFTGAMCPPCVAADMAFDGLEKSFAPQDVVLLQYHLHIPGPDALTNTDAEKRAEFYGKTLRGTPTIYFNGKLEKDTQGGGGKEDAEEKYKEYRAAVETLVEKPAQAQIEATAVRTGDKITIRAAVKNVEKPGETVRLRFALVEDWVRYKARNGTMYHHRVVRAMPGGAAGFALTKKEAEHTATVNLAEVRTGIDKYLDAFVKNEGPFPDAQRPMRFRDLRVVAFVQNDEGYDVLQALDVAVKSE